MATVQPIVTFRVDARREIGLGHLRRCLTLADELRSRSCATRIVSGEPFTPAVSAFVRSHPVFCIGDAVRTAARQGAADEQAADAGATLALIGVGNGASWVVVDSYELGVGWERAVRAAGHRVLAIDDFRDRLHDADLLVSDAAVPFDPRLNECDGARTLVGRPYTLIGPEYAYRASPAPRKDSLRLLISYGGSDATGETVKALGAIDALMHDTRSAPSIARVDVVVGLFNPRRDEIAAAAQRIAGSRVHVAPAGLAALLEDSDIFLTAGGNSLTEALALRKPCLVTVTADNQQLAVDKLAADGVIRIIGAHYDVDATGLAMAIAQTCADLEAFAARVASHAVFDHLGAGRIADVMVSAGAATQPTRLQRGRR